MNLHPGRCSPARGMTLMEVMIAVALVSLVFGVAYRIMDQARRESRKGFWLQKAITELRNGTRAISMRLKKTSYPTTIARSGGRQIVVSYKEKRTYDHSGRLRNLVVKSSNAMDLMTKTGVVRSSAAETVLMRFPVCVPEMDIDSYTSGVVTWIEVVMGPGPDFPINGLSRIFLRERDEAYDTRALPDRAYGLSTAFDPALAVASRKILVGDVDQVRIDTWAIDELSGVHVSSAGAVGTTTKKKYLVSLRIDCMNPIDKTMTIGDQSSVTVNTDVGPLP
ncbi:MAG TPA: prepilin-type N-terminal cleavage/methylation domain-containing protein [Candidatus Ozemobacteraceae bacterium]|nr:prepilin-type N-terminal cleavage/methylation domain-containing protein [Candidatus Ozemobacteraceae bacterium]HQG27631.1 prepilin-type N-terminal cleavage/methylation domain-containing protein [Candidatus Ozemobacteraceae bacterium]